MLILGDELPWMVFKRELNVDVGVGYSSQAILQIAHPPRYPALVHTPALFPHGPGQGQELKAGEVAQHHNQCWDVSTTLSVGLTN